jgi:hippurate hydrolase
MSVLNRVAEFHPDMQRWRRHLHARPELGFEEFETADFIASRLHEFGIEVRRGLAGTGVVGRLEGARPGGGAIGLRADMDALPILEDTGHDHASAKPGVMHACGHDGHCSMLLGAARHLAETRDFAGTVYFIFQPAEETGGGAGVMVSEGLFRDCPMDEVYGLHNWPGLEEGTFSVRPGAIMAASDRFDIVITGTGCHAGMPHNGSDPIATGALIVSALQLITSRRTAPHDATVVSVTQFEAGDTYNVIPDQARLRGTLRSLSEERRAALRADLERTVVGTAATHGLSASVEIHPGYPVTVNSAEPAEFAAEIAGEISGRPVRSDLPASMGSEDFAFMLNERPGCYVWLGAGPSTNGRQLHSARYDFNDSLLPIGASYWVKLAQARLAALSR